MANKPQTPQQLLSSFLKKHKLTRAEFNSRKYLALRQRFISLTLIPKFNKLSQREAAIQVRNLEIKTSNEFFRQEWRKRKNIEPSPYTHAKGSGSNKPNLKNIARISNKNLPQGYYYFVKVFFNDGSKKPFKKLPKNAIKLKPNASRYQKIDTSYGKAFSVPLTKNEIINYFRNFFSGKTPDKFTDLMLGGSDISGVLKSNLTIVAFNYDRVIYNDGKKRKNKKNK